MKEMISRFDLKEFKKYFFVSVILILTIVGLSKVKYTQSKYETEKDTNITPNFAFFIADVQSQSQTLTLDNIVPSNQPYLYTFTVSNFKDGKKSGVDLEYEIEVIATTNLPLNIKLYKNPNFSSEANVVTTVTQNEDDVYFKHLKYTSENLMSYNTPVTDTYTLWVEFPLSYRSDFASLNGVIELIDVEVKARQVVEP